MHWEGSELGRNQNPARQVGDMPPPPPPLHLLSYRVRNLHPSVLQLSQGAFQGLLMSW